MNRNFADAIGIARPIRLGYVPLVDAAPLIIAKEFGLFAARGLRVELVREPGWATVRDKLVHGLEIDGAHALAGLAFATTFGIRCIARHCLTGLILNRHGTGVTFSRELWEGGLRAIDDLKPGLVGAGGRKLRLGIVHPASSHHHLLRSLFGRRGLRLAEQAEVIVLPPELMALSLERGMIDGFCAGEPWNSAAIESGAGFCLATSSELCESHPEKVLLVSAEFATLRHGEHVALIAALIEVCRVCDDDSQRAQVARVLSSAAYLDVPEKVVRNSLCGKFHRGRGRARLSAAALRRGRSAHRTREAPRGAARPPRRARAEAGGTALHRAVDAGRLGRCACRRRDR